MRGRDAKLHYPDLGRLDRPRSDSWAMASLEQVATGCDSVSSRASWRLFVLARGPGIFMCRLANLR
jgi:hypothetical protein